MCARCWGSTSCRKNGWWPVSSGTNGALTAAKAIDVVAFSGSAETARAVRQALAGRPGPIVPLVTELLNPAAYAHERAVCVDITAAGGNATLLAAA